jgi:hypothetical protein
MAPAVSSAREYIKLGQASSLREDDRLLIVATWYYFEAVHKIMMGKVQMA